MGYNVGKQIVTDGLILHLDAANPRSYPGSGTTWYDLSGKEAHALSSNLPTYVNDSTGAYWNFNGSSNKFYSVDLEQDYRDICVVHRLIRSGGFSMLFAKYSNYDYSLRFNLGAMNAQGVVNSNDWHLSQTADVFDNGLFNQSGAMLANKWSFTRAYRSNTTGFGTSFRYEISSGFMSRYYQGYIALILCYNRKLTQSEVLQNFETLRGRYGI